MTVEHDDNYPEDDVLYQDGPEEECETGVETEGQTEFEIATELKTRTTGINAVIEVLDAETQYEEVGIIPIVPTFDVNFDDNSRGSFGDIEDTVDRSILQAMARHITTISTSTQTAVVYNTLETAIVID